MRDNDSTDTVLVVRSPASPLATSMMLHADQLANVLRCEVQGKTGVTRMHWMRGFSKERYKVTTCMFWTGRDRRAHPRCVLVTHAVSSSGDALSPSRAPSCLHQFHNQTRSPVSQPNSCSVQDLCESVNMDIDLINRGNLILFNSSFLTPVEIWAQFSIISSWTHFNKCHIRIVQFESIHSVPLSNCVFVSESLYHQFCLCVTSTCTHWTLSNTVHPTPHTHKQKHMYVTVFQVHEHDISVHVSYQFSG